MSHDANGMMAKHFGLNMVSRLWKKRNFFAISNEKLDEYMKLAMMR
jgi:hypothetical protein